MKKNILIIILSIFLLVQFSLNLYLWKATEVPKIHVLNRPLKIYSFEGKYSQNATLPEYSILPEGTVLYDDSDSLNRRVKVYFNLQSVYLLTHKKAHPSRWAIRTILALNSN